MPDGGYLDVKQAQAENMPPTRDELLPALQRANYQTWIRYNNIVANPDISYLRVRPKKENCYIRVTGWTKIG